MIILSSPQPWSGSSIQHRNNSLSKLELWAEFFCFSINVVLWGHLDIHDSWTSLSLNLRVSVSFPLQGYDESYTDTAYETYDSYYSQPQAWVTQTTLWFSPASHTHIACLLVSFKTIWEWQICLITTLPKFGSDDTLCFIVWMTVLFWRTIGTCMFHVREPSFDPIHGSQLSTLLTLHSAASRCFSEISFALFSTDREPEYYDYGHGESTESYESYGKEKQFVPCQQRWPNFLQIKRVE